MAKVNSLKVKIAYEDATSRSYTFNGVENNQLPDVKMRIITINDAIEAGEADGNAFKNIFVSNNGAAAVGITEAKLIQTEQEVIYSAS